MRNYVWGIAVIGASLMAMQTMAQPPEESAESDRPAGPGLRQRMIAEFDKDGDGRLNEEELREAREAARERQGRRAREGAESDDGPPEGRRGPAGARGPGRPGGPEGRRGPDGNRGPEGRPGPSDGRGP